MLHALSVNTNESGSISRLEVGESRQRGRTKVKALHWCSSLYIVIRFHLGFCLVCKFCHDFPLEDASNTSACYPILSARDYTPLGTKRLYLASHPPSTNFPLLLPPRPPLLYLESQDEKDKYLRGEREREKERWRRGNWRTMRR